MKKNGYQRRGSAIATTEAIGKLSSDVRAARAQHLIVREWAQRLANAQADLRGTQDVLERTKRLLPEAEAAVEAAQATLAKIEGENPIMSG